MSDWFEGVDSFQDYFDAVGELIQYLKELFGAGLTEIKDFTTWFKDCSEQLTSILNAYVHPYFIPFIALAIACALIQKFVRFGEKQ